MTDLCSKYILRKSIFNKINKYFHGVVIYYFCVNKSNVKYTIKLYFLIQSGHLNLIKKIFNKSLPFGITDFEKKSALFCASCCNNIDIFKWFYFNNYHIGGFTSDVFYVASSNGYKSIVSFIYSQKPLFELLTNMK